MNDSEIKIVTRNNFVITLKELFEGKERSRKEIASLSFSQKIRSLIALQEIACKWGGRKDVYVWKI